MIIFIPILPWSYVAVGAAGLAILLMLMRGAVDYNRREAAWHTLGGNRKTRAAVLMLSIMTAALFAAAAMNPRWTEKTGTSPVHLQVVVDVSDSIMRAEGGWTGVHNRCKRQLTEDLDALPNELLANGTAGILTFRGNTADAGSEMPLNQLTDTFNQLDTGMLATGEGTDIQAGLELAGKRVEQAGGRGAVLLMSDGNQTGGDALKAAKQLAKQGIPVHVYPLTSRGPALAITAADLPRRTHAGVETFLRGVMQNGRKTDENATITLGRNPQLPDMPGNPGASVTRRKKIRIPGGQWARLRWPVVFEGCGLQFVDLTLSAEDGKEPHQRRFFTHVNRPPRILAVGGDNRWMSAIPQETAEITEVPAELFKPHIHLKDIDAVVIGSVAAQQFHTGTLKVMADAVQKGGMGLLLINGGHQGTEEETETVLMSYNDTPLEELLPLKSGPRAFMPDAPPRDVVILIDTSGSMGGWRISMAKNIARYIIRDLLRPEDRLDLITFTTGAGHLIANRLMDEAGKQAAIDKLEQVSSGGGTNPNRALALVGNRKLSACGLIFISDGEFGHVSYRPDCRATVFAVGRHSVAKSSPLWQLADPFPVPKNFNPESIIIPYFDPEPRLKFFEPGTFTPLSMERLLPKSQRLPIPSLPLEGAAVSSLKKDAILNGVRPKLTDPVLAFGEGGTGYVGVFTSEIPDLWLNRPEGRNAVKEWVARVVAYMERERYDFKMNDRGDVIDLRVSLTAKKGKLPRITQLALDIRFPKEAPVGVALKPDDLSPGTFHGQIRVERTHQTRRGVLWLKEWGPDALARPQQVPILIPPKGTVRPAPSAEEYSYGQNRALLRAIAAAGGGVFDPPEGTSLFRGIPAENRGKPLWPLFLAIAAICYLCAIAARRWKP
ncbi:MAG: VWA domain-containing protein [bacterium]|nr:VWA domain-containing protein [bacterium]